MAKAEPEGLVEDRAWIDVDASEMEWAMQIELERDAAAREEKPPADR